MKKVLEQFPLRGNLVSCERYGNGHINETYLVRTDRQDYILQKINRHVFKDVPALMRNIHLVTEHLAKKDPDPRHTLTIVPTSDDALFFTDENGDYWRLYDFVTDSLCFESVSSPHDFYLSGKAFGQFQNLLADFDASRLTETIPRFHDTPNRYENLRRAIERDVKGRAASVKDEIAFALEREEKAGALMNMLRAGQLPLRVVHNDTKLNNILFDRETREPLCVIDLDTVMPGLAANDYGDSIRFGASSGAEDERDLSLIKFSMDLFKTYTEGFLSSCGGNLTENEIKTLPLGALMMTLECGVRFLTDHLEGDVYFSLLREGQNLDRCRTQFKRLSEMEKCLDAMNAFVGA